MNANKVDSNNLPSDAPIPRLCHLIKWPDFDGFGFNLQIGHFIGKVDDDSPAQHADLREGDQIIEVNNVPISNENHKQVVQRIKAVPNETRLLVINQNEYEWYKDRNIIIRSTQSNILHCKTPVPRPSSSVEIIKENVNDEQEINGKNESTNVSLNASSSNLSTKELQENGIINKQSENNSENQPIERQESSQLAKEIFSALEAKESSSVDEVANKLKSTKLQNETTTNLTIESNNNSEKAANQNLVSSVKSTPVTRQKSNNSHNFIVVNSEAEFAAEKRLKDEQMKNNLINKNSTPIIPIDKEQNNHINLSSSSISSSNNNLSTTNSNQQNNLDINLNMSASEMRKIIASRRNVKTECKKQPLDLRQKYEIIQQM